MGFKHPRVELIDLIRRERCDRRSAPVQLGPGGETDVYLDIKGLLITTRRMKLTANALLRHMFDLDIRPSAIGGPTMGADVLSHAVVMESSYAGEWFSVRDHPKITHGLGKWIEGAALGEGDKVILTDDVVNTGESLWEAAEIVSRTGADIIAIMPLVDRGDAASKLFSRNYYPLMTYADLGIEPLVPV
jgi:orotate phosphoribosyltransferase